MQAQMEGPLGQASVEFRGRNQAAAQGNTAHNYRQPVATG